jgi:hypothetical protein
MNFTRAFNLDSDLYLRGFATAARDTKEISLEFLKAMGEVSTGIWERSFSLWHKGYSDGIKSARGL